MAGESAAEVARRQREKADRLNRSAELYERGAEGERATAEVLAQLPAGDWIVLHDVRWPGRRSANVDHVVVGPPGVFVIDSKNWTGSIEVSGSVLRQNGRLRESTVAGAAEAGLAVGQLAPLLRPDLVHPVLCFVRDEPLAGEVGGVTVCATSNVVPTLMSRPHVLDAEQVRLVCHDLERGFRAAAETPVPPRPATPGAVRVAGDLGKRRSSSPKSRRGRKRPPVGRELAKMAVVLVAAGVLATHPGILTAIGDVVSKQLTSNLQTTTPDDAGTKPGQQHGHDKKRLDNRRQPAGQR